MKENKMQTNAKILWEYHRLNIPLKKADFILVLGSKDKRVASFASELMLNSLAPLLICSGGSGKITSSTWSEPEAQIFAEIAISKGVNKRFILIEPLASNTGENILFTKKLLDDLNIVTSSGIIITKPYMERRALATAEKQWTNIHWQVGSPKISFEEYPNNEISEKQMIDLMVGDLQRIKLYAEKGFQSEQHIPNEVWKSYEFLKDNGYDTFVIR